MSSRIVYLNGHFLPLEQAHVSVMDRGFLFGDGVYEVIPMFHGKLFRPHQHLQRLKTSLAAIRIDYSFVEKNLINVFDELFKRNSDQGQDRSFYLQVTRGAAENREHVFPKTKVSPTIFAQCTGLTLKNTEQLSKGFKVITAPDIRWAQCYIKAVTLLPNTLIAQQALEKDAVEAILIRNGMAVEGVASNLFIVKDNTLISPPTDGTILSGITRDFIIEIAKRHHISFAEKNIPLELLKTADEVWMTSSTKEVFPIIQIDSDKVGNGKAGPLWQQFFKYYQDAKLNE